MTFCTGQTRCNLLNTHIQFFTQKYDVTYKRERPVLTSVLTRQTWKDHL